MNFLVFLTWKCRGQFMHKTTGYAALFTSCPVSKMPFSLLSWPAGNIASWEVIFEQRQVCLKGNTAKTSAIHIIQILFLPSTLSFITEIILFAFTWSVHLSHSFWLIEKKILGALPNKGKKN